MEGGWNIWICRLWVLGLMFIASGALAQITYFEQSYDGAGPFTSLSPNVGQFDKFVQTNTSSYQIGNGALQMTRALNPNPMSTSGLVKAVRSTAFAPTPETLYIQVTLSVKDISTTTANAVYFYIGENFNPDNNSIPSNLLFFSRFSFNFNGTGLVVHDFQKNVNSAPILSNTSFTLTWVLNNSSWGQVYKFPETASEANYKVMPYRYDLWVNGQLLVDEATGYPLPGSGVPNPYSPNKLTNFEIRFRDGFGTLAIDYILIRDINGVLPEYISGFQAQQLEGTVRLSWVENAQVFGPYGYLVQRSQDGRYFETVGAVNSMGPGAQVFEYLDQVDAAEAGFYYYRVQALDAEGEILETTGMKSVFRPFHQQLPFVYSNPAAADLVRLYDGGMGSAFRLFTKAGLEIPLTFSRGAVKEMLLYPAYEMAPGMYLLTFDYRGMKRSLRVAIY